MSASRSYVQTEQVRQGSWSQAVKSESITIYGPTTKKREGYESQHTKRADAEADQLPRLNKLGCKCYCTHKNICGSRRNPLGLARAAASPIMIAPRKKCVRPSSVRAHFIPPQVAVAICKGLARVLSSFGSNNFLIYGVNAARSGLERRRHTKTITNEDRR